MVYIEQPSGSTPDYIQQQPSPPGYTEQQPGLNAGYIEQKPLPNPGYIDQKPLANPAYIQQQPLPNPAYIQQQPLPNPIYIQQQPGPNPGMLAGGGNRNVKDRPVGPNGREWSYGLCGCELGTCLLAWCFPCILYAQVKHRYEHLNGKGIPDPEHGGMCNADCMLHGLVSMCCGCGWIFQMGTRKHIRQRYNIKGGGCEDCCTALCCTPCELTQESRELDLEERSFSKPG